MNSAIKTAYYEWVSNNKIVNGWNITLTAKQVYNGIDGTSRLDENLLTRNFKHFRNKLNQSVYGNGYRRFGKELKMLVVQETSENNRLHIHCVIEHDHRLSEDKFDYLIRSIWSKTDFGYDQVHIEKPSDQLRQDGWLTYIMKRRTKKNYTDCLDLTNSSCLYL